MTQNWKQGREVNNATIMSMNIDDKSDLTKSSVFNFYRPINRSMDRWTTFSHPAPFLHSISSILNTFPGIITERPTDKPNNGPRLFLRAWSFWRGWHFRLFWISKYRVKKLLRIFLSMSLFLEKWLRCLKKSLLFLDFWVNSELEFEFRKAIYIGKAFLQSFFL